MTRPPRPHRPRAAPRAGLSLYEVLLAIAILLPALVVLTQGISGGARAAVHSRLQTEAILRCDSLVSEVTAGVRPMQAASRQNFDDGAAGWTWSLEIGGGPHPDVLQLTAEVEHMDRNGAVNASYRLTRLIRDPQLFADAAAMNAAQQQQQQSSTNTSGSSTSTMQPAGANSTATPGATR